MTDYQANFIQKLRFFRKRAGLSQAKLAELCNVATGTIGNIESGLTKPSFDLIIQIALSVKVPPADFFTTDDSEFPPSDSLTNTQYEIVRETVNDEFSKALQTIMKKLKQKNVN